MCYNVAYLERKQEKYYERYKDIIREPFIQAEEKDEPLAYYFLSGFVHPELPIVRYDGIKPHKWGLIPAWVKDEKQAKDIRTKTLNAVGETAYDKPSFKKSIAAKRCILGVSGFFEWRHVNEVKYPYFIKAMDEEFTSLGCIYEEWVNKQTGEVVPTFAIITTPANSLMEKIHNSKKRMPLILNRNNEKHWIDPDLPEDLVKKMIVPYDEKKMHSYTVSKMVNSAKNNRNVGAALEQVEYPELQLV